MQVIIIHDNISLKEENFVEFIFVILTRYSQKLTPQKSAHFLGSQKLVLQNFGESPQPQKSLPHYI